MIVHTHTRYIRLEKEYEEQYEYSRYNNDEQEGASGSADREYERYLQLSSLQSGSLTFVAIYTVILAIGLSLFGSTAIVGFTSLRGVYIAPCFSSAIGSARLRLGIFCGAIIFFANLLLVCAVIFGEVRVSEKYSYEASLCRPALTYVVAVTPRSMIGETIIGTKEKRSEGEMIKSLMKSKE